MIYIIDHQDSFTWNVVHQFSKFDKVICSNYYDINNNLLIKVMLLFFLQDLVLQKITQFLQKFITNIKVKKKYWYMFRLSNDFA